MTTSKLTAGSKFPDITVPDINGGTLDLKATAGNNDWKMIIVYRGKHCPLCAKYLTDLKDKISEFNDEKVDVVVVSADSSERVQSHMAQIEPNYDVGYNLSIEQMETLGLYISEPVSESESDRPFAEPGLFIINADGNIQLVNIANAPFLRPEFDAILMGIKFIRNPENNYPIRGTRTYA